MKTPFAQVVHVISEQSPAVLPTRFQALDNLFRAATASGTVIRREVVSVDSGLDAIAIFSPENPESEYVLTRINDHTFTIRRQSVTASSRPE